MGDNERNSKNLSLIHISIDLVVVNLYPFKETLLAGGSQAEMIEKIDIGGPSMLSLIHISFKQTNMTRLGLIA